MIVLSEFHAENFNNAQRHAKWNADAIVECDFKVKSSIESPHILWNKHTITFSSSEIPFLLGSFECGKIRVKVKVGFRDLSVALPVKVEIFEVRNSNDAKTKQL